MKKPHVKSSNRIACDDCHKYFLEEELDLDGTGKQFCNDCEQSIWNNDREENQKI